MIPVGYHHPVEKQSNCITQAQFLRELDRMPSDREMYQQFAGDHNIAFSKWWSEAEAWNGMYIVTFHLPGKDVPSLSYIKMGPEIIFFKGCYRFESILSK